MDKFCVKCGAELDETTGLCPNCNAEKNMRSITNCETEQKEKKEKKKEKRAQWSIAKRIRRLMIKIMLSILFLFVATIGVTGVLVCQGIIDIPFLDENGQDNLLKIMNEKNISVQEKEIVMIDDMHGTASLIVELPNYEVLFKKAKREKNPEQYIFISLLFKKFETQEYEIDAKITVENGKEIIHSEDDVKQVLEEALLHAINEL